MVEQYFSQYKQDKFINEVVFNNKSAGFFIDIGAHDGVTINNSIFFERYRNWTGVCIEPNPNVFERLIENRKSININKCIGKENKKVIFTQITGYSEMLSGIADKYHPNHIKRIDNLILRKGDLKNDIELGMITLDSIMDIRNKDIDFISIDTEGNEFEIVSSIDFKILNINCLIIENNYADNRINEYLNLWDFKLLSKLDVDEVYVKKQNINFGVIMRLYMWKFKIFYKRVIEKIRSLF